MLGTAHGREDLSVAGQRRRSALDSSHVESDQEVDAVIDQPRGERR